MDITTLSIEQLEALCYKHIEQRDDINRSLAAVQAELAKKREQERAEQNDAGKSKAAKPSSPSPTA